MLIELSREDVDIHTTAYQGPTRRGDNRVTGPIFFSIFELIFYAFV
jgi:hypothetical protein